MKVWIGMQNPEDQAPLSRRAFLKIGATLALVSPQIRSAADQPPVIWHGDQSTPLIAFTFDDCYSYPVLRQVEEELIRNPFIRVTFFPVGQAVLEHADEDPGIWKRLYARGHEIGYHTFAHQFGSSLSTNQMIADYEQWLATMTSALGETPPVKFARPPYADMSNSFLEMCTEKDLIVAMWSAELSLEPKLASQDIEALRDGDIVLFHMGYWDLSNLKTALPVLRQRSLQTVTLSALYFPDVRPLRKEEILCSRSMHRCLEA